MSRLADVIEGRKNEIVLRWRNDLNASIPAEALPNAQIIDSLPKFLDELTSALRSQEHIQTANDPQPKSATAVEHGTQRFQMGFDVAAVVREYAILRDVLFAVAEENAIAIVMDEHRTLSRVLLSAVADAVGQYAIERDQAMRVQTARHLGFLAHELRNPLSSARLSLMLLRLRGEVPKNRSTQTLERSLWRMSELIDRSLLELKLKSAAELHIEHIDLTPFLRELLDELAAEAELKTLTFELNATPDLELEADRKLLYSTLFNLVRNAVKFTPEGGTITVTSKSSGPSVVIEVKDECGGLQEGQIEKLFNPFVQMGQDRSGFGLGLAIAKQATEAHNGSLRVHNLPDTGCVFVLELPAKATSPSPRP